METERKKKLKMGLNDIIDETISNSLEKTQNWKFHHLGVIVGDMEKAIEYYKTLGFVGFPNKRPEPPAPAAPMTWKKFITYDETVIEDGKLLVPPKPGTKPGRIEWCSMGIITLELTLPGDGAFRTVHNDFLDNFGEGIEHIAYSVSLKNYEEEKEKMKANGLPIVMSGEAPGGGGFTYYDARKVGGIIVELMTGGRQ